MRRRPVKVGEAHHDGRDVVVAVGGERRGDQGVGRGLGRGGPAHDTGGVLDLEDVPHAVGRGHEGDVVGPERVAADLGLRDHADRPEPSIAEAPGHHEPSVSPDDVGRVELGPHPEDACPLVGNVDPVITRQALRSRLADSHDAAVSHMGRDEPLSTEQEGRDRRAAVGVRRRRLQLVERLPEGVGRIEPGLERAKDREVKVGGGAVRNVGAAVAVVDGGEQPVTLAWALDGRHESTSIGPAHEHVG